MSIIETTNRLRDEIKKHGNHKEISRLSGVNFHWLCKFVTGEIENPTIKNVAKIEAYFSKKQSLHADETTPHPKL